MANEKRRRLEVDEDESPLKRSRESKVVENFTDSEGEEIIESRLGIIKKIELVDFMCHSNLSVDFGSRLNFINGENGSGKSAILTALTVALGGKASSTNRSSNMQGFIKENAQKSTIKVWMYNEGSDAYKPDQYGEMILIERVLSKENKANSYRLKNGITNHVVSIKKSELTAITDHMAIQVENPVNILSQDSSREFLSSSKPDQLYQWFLKGTQLLQLSEDLEAVRETVSIVESTIEKNQELLPEIKAKKLEWERKYRMITEARQMVQNMQEMEEKLAWIFVSEAEKTKEEQVNTISEIEGKIEKLETRAEAERNKISILDEKIKEKQDLLIDFVKKNDELFAKKNTISATQTEFISELRRLKNNEMEMNNDARQYRKRYENLEKQIENEKKRLEKDVGSEREKMEKRKAEIENENQEILNELNAGKIKQKEIDMKKSDLNRALNQSLDRAEQFKIRISQKRRDLEKLRNQSGDKLVAFGRGVSEVVSQISKARWTGMTPVGPIGKFVKVADRKWSVVIETVLDKSLNMFMVDNHKDRAALDRIMKNCDCNSGILVCNSELFDYSGGEPDGSFNTLLRSVEISDELVKRQLINLNRIEQILFVEVRSNADDIMRSNNGKFPRNVVACFTVDGYQVGSQKGGFSTVAVNLVQQSGRLSTDLDSIISKFNIEVLEIQKKLSDENFESNRLKDKLDELTRESREIDTKRREGFKKMDIIQEQLNKIELEITDQEPANIMALEAELRDVQQSLQMVQSQFADQLELKKKTSEKLSTVGSELEEVALKIDEVTNNISEYRQEINEYLDAKQKISENIQFWKAKVDKRLSNIREVKDSIKQIDKEIETLTKQATQIAKIRPHIEPHLTSKKLQADVEALSKMITEIESNQEESIEEIAKQSQIHIGNYNTAKKQLKQMIQYALTLKEAHQMRLQRWVDFRESMTIRVKSQFTLHLYRRGYAGSLEFDHNAKLLYPRVNTDHDLALMAAVSANGGNQSNGTDAVNGKKKKGDAKSGADARQQSGLARKDNRSLSGGEKSFTTISFLLSLWEAMSCPIRALDEFDVFMDAANRAISMRMIVKSARCSPETQFLLISPQDMTIKPASDIKILLLEPPSRN
ncbi:Structural maintenance of chromosomes protein 6 [Smittium mucronatum]|uniref:Structural maintenance of chromosomes protein 6 n=1 Tax=Smittium mucronatum TaxID=133383 RepID=A0A1R0H5E1_9FUNG|nr:Structural maintenance of chromosomes protein 6 [Smittium mucronatum]